MIPGLKGVSLLKYLNYKLEDLTDQDISVITQTLAPGAVISPETKQTLLEICRSSDVDAVADILSRPELIVQLQSKLTAPPATDACVRCPHCGDFFLFSL